ncbi:MAG TPA: hypothetical protein VJY35_07650 [Candidatus Eisenbacteria bacterium]|nr:hypothetical protein [Candidatus Eisenbacteria bacterium]
MRRAATPLSLALIAGLCLAAAAGAATPAPPVKIKSITEMPEAVQKTVKAETAGATVKGMSKEIDEEGKTVYEIEMVLGGLTKDINIGDDGTLLVAERQMTLAALPAPVRAQFLKSAGKRKIRMVESVTMMGKLAYYEAHVVTGKTLTEVKVDPAGAVVP